MANIKSAIKRVEIAERNRLRNKSYKSAVKTLTKKYLAAVSKYAASPTSELEQEVQKTQAAAYSKIDKAVKRGALHSNTGARKKSLIARALRKHEPARSAS
ncbi:MAG: 30S ribosomal protein S20 [Stenomitos rutilans HA7619-LM2]|nr:30S ribosomal protein S20 [Stenomitos rutilans HA7619-LM2]